MTLPTTLDAVTGLRAARWTRESTAGQYDAFGADAQREQQDRAIERYGLADTGLEWQVAHSGRTIASTDQFADMLARAGTDYDILVVGYVSRFARDLRTAVNARHDLHRAGAAILFADERILSSDEERWDEWAREAVEAESYSRKLARRIREGYAAKRRRLGEPGGRAPLGFTRTGRPPALVVDELRLPVVRRIFDAAGRGTNDREVALANHVGVHTVRSVLSNPIYIGLLRDGTQAAVEPIVDRDLFEKVQRIRAARSRRGTGQNAKRHYALSMLRCAACGRRLIGDSGRYRHVDACADFTAARRRQAFRNRLVRTAGQSYPAKLYEGWVEGVVDKAALTVADMVSAAELYRSASPVVDEVGLRRITRQRDEALRAYAVSRDVKALEGQMKALDAEEARLRQPTDSRPAWEEVVAVLRDLPAMWREAEGADRRVVAEALIDSVDVLGVRTMTVLFKSGIRGEVTVGVGARGFEASLPTIKVTMPWGAAEGIG